jgi:hypothetical protein
MESKKVAHMRTLKKAIFAVAVLLLFSVPFDAFAAQDVLRFTVGIPGKTGCLVCHDDPTLVKIEGGKVKSLYVSPKDFEKVHKDLTCLDCHKDFTYKSIKPKAENWKVIAGTACKDCHDEKKGIDHTKNYEDYRESIHGKKLLLEKDEKAPTCAGCHGYHGKWPIRKLSDEKEMLEFRKEAYKVCGRCHQKYWDNYNDWFHGKAYKHGAPDAPPCWDCHVAHEILPSNDIKSPTSKGRIAEQCGKCHKGSDIAFAEYAPYIHKRNELIEKNIVMQLLFKVQDIVKGLFQKIGSIVG